MALLKLRCNERQVWECCDPYHNEEIKVDDDTFKRFNDIMWQFECIQEEINELYYHQRNNDKKMF